MDTQTAMVIFAIIAALGMMTVVTVDVMLTMQEADAKGCAENSTAYFASNFQCFNPGPP
jgi:hypothetical protein